MLNSENFKNSKDQLTKNLTALFIETMELNLESKRVLNTIPIHRKDSATDLMRALGYSNDETAHLKNLRTVQDNTVSV